MTPFSFNADRYDLWPLYETIVSYYPIGIYKDAHKLVKSYPGQQRMTSLVEDQIHNDEHFQARFGPFSRLVETSTGLPHQGTTFGMAPCVSGYILLDHTEVAGFTRIRRIHYMVSLLGPYFTIIGDEIAEMEIGGSKMTRTQYLVVSPIDGFQEKFEQLEQIVESYFPGYRFVPCFIYRQPIEGLILGYFDDLNLIYNALFNVYLDLTNWVEGDRSYKAENWQHSDGRKFGTWASYPGNTVVD